MEKHNSLIDKERLRYDGAYVWEDKRKQVYWNKLNIFLMTLLCFTGMCFAYLNEQRIDPLKCWYIEYYTAIQKHWDERSIIIVTSWHRKGTWIKEQINTAFTLKTPFKETNIFKGVMDAAAPLLYFSYLAQQCKQIFNRTDKLYSNYGWRFK